MHIGQGQVTEIILQPGGVIRRITCLAELVPAPGQYVLADDGSDAPLPVPVFPAGSSPGGFLAAPPLPAAWTPGAALKLHGPLGRGFSIPAAARRIALAALDHSAVRLLPLIPRALAQGAAITLLSAVPPEELPEEVEVQPLTAWTDVYAWADYLALDLERGTLSEWLPRLAPVRRRGSGSQAQILIRSPMPCGGIAECGICAVTLGQAWKMACKDGPVFDLNDLILRG